jgi:hypothetical protein
MRIAVACSFVALFAAGIAGAQPAQPQQGQSQAQQDADRRECKSASIEQSGFDPATPAPAKQAAPQKRGGVLKGAMVGAAAGEIIDDKGGEGAAVGGVIGGMRQGSKNRQARDQAEAQYQQQMSVYNQGRSDYARAWNGCMQSRGYTTG